VLIGSSFNSDEGVLFSPQPRAAVERDAMPLIEIRRRVRSRRRPGQALSRSFECHRGMHVAAGTALCLLPPHSIRHSTAGRQHVQDNDLIYDVQGNQTAVIAYRRSMQACRRACVIGFLFESAPQRVAISEIVILMDPYGRSRGLTPHCIHAHVVYYNTMRTMMVRVC
jgi:hypothetical protein